MGDSTRESCLGRYTGGCAGAWARGATRWTAIEPRPLERQCSSSAGARWGEDGATHRTAVDVCGWRHPRCKLTCGPAACAQEEGVKKAEEAPSKAVRKTKKQLAKERLTNGASA